MLDYGLEGYGLYWYCIELIASKVDKSNITFELEHDARIISRHTGTSEQKINEMMTYFINLGLFECSDNTITCLKLAKRLDSSMTSNIEMRKIIQGVKNHDAVMTQSAVSHDSVMREEIRSDKIRISNTSSQRLDQMNYQAIQDSFNEHLTKASKVLKMTDKRKRIIKKFFREFDLDMQKWTNYIEYINNSPECAWMFETRDRGNGQAWQPKGFEFIASEACYLKVKEQYS